MRRHGAQWLRTPRQWPRPSSIHSRDEGGFAVPVVIFMLLGMMAILAVGAAAAINTQRGTVRDANSKSALAVAESGVDTAFLRYARAEPTATEPCVDANEQTAAANYDGWCDPVAGDVDGSPFVYYARPNTTSNESGFEYEVEVVSVGTAGGESRVVYQSGKPIFAVDIEPIFLTEAIVADTHMHLAPGAKINGSIGSNGSIDVANSTKVCGGIRYGPGSNTDVGDLWNAQEGCPEHEPEEPVAHSFPLERAELPEGENWEQNNSYFEGLNANLAWDPVARTLRTTKNNVAFTITEPGPFLLCRLDITGQSIMRVAPGVEAIFYFDDPANCNLQKQRMSDVPTATDDGYLQMLFDRGNLTVDSGQPFPIMYFLGSETEETFIDINTNAGAAGEFKGVIYAPDTHIVNSRSGFRFRGAMVGRTVWIDPGAEAESDVEIIGGDFQIGANETIYTVFTKDDFRECPTSAAASQTPYALC